jgi:hypothetical protein
MKIYFRNKAAKLTLSSSAATCVRCPFYKISRCPFCASTIVDCYDKGWWIDGESLDIFKV